MRKWLIFIAIGWISCKQTVAPRWLNESDAFRLPTDTLLFESCYPHWEATLLTFTQPVQMSVHYDRPYIRVFIHDKKGAAVGPAHLSLSSGKERFYFPLNIANFPDTSIHREFRSPKTVNPDSSLNQQRLAYSIDNQRNILSNHQHFFQEGDLTLEPKEGVYRAIQDDPLTAYYIQPGSCTNIPIEAKYLKEQNGFQVLAGPLYDIHRNTVADGTLVVFQYQLDQKIYRRETQLLSGYAQAFVTVPHRKQIELHAAIHDIISRTIVLNP